VEGGSPSLITSDTVTSMMEPVGAVSVNMFTVTESSSQNAHRERGGGRASTYAGKAALTEESLYSFGGELLTPGNSTEHEAAVPWLGGGDQIWIRLTLKDWNTGFPRTAVTAESPAAARNRLFVIPTLETVLIHT